MSKEYIFFLSKDELELDLRINTNPLVRKFWKFQERTCSDGSRNYNGKGNKALYEASGPEEYIETVLLTPIFNQQSWIGMKNKIINKQNAPSFLSDSFTS